MSLAAHTRIHGPLPDVPAHQLIEEVERSGLRGRGGADFPTARKLRAVAERRRVGPVIVNGSETEPASAKDRLLLARLPHLVLDGAVLAAGAVGARQVIVKVGDERGRRGAARSRVRSPRASATACRSRSSPGPRGTSPARRAPSSTTSTAAPSCRRSFRRGRSSAATAGVRR